MNTISVLDLFFSYSYTWKIFNVVVVIALFRNETRKMTNNRYGDIIISTQIQQIRHIWSMIAEKSYMKKYTYTILNNRQISVLLSTE